MWRSVALSPDFSYTDEIGTIAIAGNLRGVAVAADTASSVLRAKAKAFKADAAAVATWSPMTTGGAMESTGTMTLSVRYSPDEGSPFLGRVVVNPTAIATFGQVTAGINWNALTVGGVDEISPTIVAARGQIAFDDKYETNGGVYTALSAGTGGVGAGGVYKYSGSWVNHTATNPPGGKCDYGFSSLSVTGDSSGAVVLASSDSNAKLCRSVNAGGTWTSVDVDGGDSRTTDAAMGPGITMVAKNRAAPSRAFWSTSGKLGGVSLSVNGGVNFQDGGLTNDAYVVDTVTEANDKVAFAGAKDIACQGCDLNPRVAMFKTGTYGESAAWYRVERTPNISTTAYLDPGFLNSGVVYLRRTAAGDKSLLLSTDDGETFKDTPATPNDDEVLVTVASRTSSVAYVATDEGKIIRTKDRGVSWEELPFNVTGRRVNSLVFVTDTDFFVTALAEDNTLRVWHTTDTGATWEMLADAPWGVGDGDMTLVVGTYSATTRKGGVALITNGSTITTKDFFRLNIGTDSSWQKMDTAKEWTSLLSVTTAGLGDGKMLTLWQKTPGAVAFLRTSYQAFSGDKAEFLDDGDEKDALLNLPPPPITSGKMDTARTEPGYVLQTVAGGRIMEYTLNTKFLAPIVLTAPSPGGTVVTNTGTDGSAYIFRWNAVDKADAYDLIIGLTPDLSDGKFVNPGAITTNATEVEKSSTSNEGGRSLVAGVTYYWAVRVASGTTDLVPGTGGPGAVSGPQGSWSAPGKFSVLAASSSVNKSPELLLPTNNTITANLGPILLRWNNPPGTVQFNLEVSPAGGDGPGINLIISDAGLVAAASYTVQPPKFGTGNYVILPGATYNWLVRSSASSDPKLSLTDLSWGPFSEVRTFKTPRPESGTIQLLNPINGVVVASKKPTLAWKDTDPQMFYYEVQLSTDADFGKGPRGPIASVQSQLIHAGVSVPPSSYASPVDLTAGTYYWRVRQ